MKIVGAVYEIESGRMRAKSLVPRLLRRNTMKKMACIVKDSFSWQSIDRALNGEALPNIAPIKVTRAK